MITVQASLASLATNVILTRSPADPGCQVSEVHRLLGTVIVLAVLGSLAAILRPSWLYVAGLLAATVVWLWIDMEGAVLASAGSHGIHVADVPVLVALPSTALAAARLVVRRGRPGA
jgi:hypothetical protein